MRLLTILFAATILGASIAFAGVMGTYAYYANDLPDPGQLSQRKLFQTARILDRQGQLLEELVDPTGGRRTLVRIGQVSPLLKNATIAAEDASFYENPGFEPRAVIRAVYQLARYRSVQSGGSTITQQLVKNTLLTPEQTPERKIKEAFLALELSRRFSKDQILEMYLNEIYYGNRAYGIEAAAETYFAKPAGELTLPEASLLAGLPQAPSHYDPYTNLAAAKERQRYVLDQMVRTQAITRQQADAAFQTPLPLRPLDAATPTQAPHFVNYVRQVLEQQYGTDALFRQGLQVTTSLDLNLQRVAESTARARIAAIRDRGATNAALVSLRPATGEVLAMVGSVDFNDTAIDGQVNVALADRQPGSALKPFTYATAFLKGWNPATPVMDLPSVYGGTYRPNNFDNAFRGPMTVRSALAESRNIPAVEALQFVTIPDMLGTVHRMGIQGLRQPERYGLSVTLGGGEVRLLDLTYAYAAFANGGRQVGAPVPPERQEPGFRQFEPAVLLKVADSSGKVLYQYQPPQGAEVMDPRVAFQITSILSDNEARVPTFGRDNALVLEGRPAAAKTGTTDNFVDAWTVGYTPDLVTGVWVGNTDSTPMQDVGGSLGAGSIWNSFMKQALKDTPPTPFSQPDGIVQAEVCTLSGLLPTPECRDFQGPISGTHTDLFARGLNLPTRPDDWHKRIEVCAVNGKVATPLTPPNARELRIFVQFPERYQAWAAANGYPPPPTETCDDIYKGERIAQVASPGPNDRIAVGATVQVVGSAYIDDFKSYTLDVGPGTDPNTWATLTDQRPQAVDNALLGVWNTAGHQPGTYTLRLRVFDSFSNAQEGRSSVTLAAPATPTPTQAPTRAPVPTPAATRPAQPTPAATTPPKPAGTPAPKPGR